MTVEELEILVEASIEPALKELKRLMPEIRKQVTQAVQVAQKSMEQVDMKTVSNKIQKAVQQVKNKIASLKKSSQNNEIKIKINNKEAEKQISQLEKEIESLQKKINARQMKLDFINPQIDKIVDDTRNEVTPQGISKNDKSMDNVVNNALASNKDFTSLNNQAQKLYTEMEAYNKQLSEAKTKMSQLKQETLQTATTQNKLSSFFSAFKNKLGQAKISVLGLRSSFKQLPKLTQNITNNIGKMNTSIKGSLKHVLKYAGALLSLRSIYATLSSVSNSWLSSENKQAKQLTANISYLKYSLGSSFGSILTFISNKIYDLLKALQTVIYALFRVNIFANASAKSYSAMAGSASKAKKETQGLTGIHSEINNVQSQDNSNGGSGSIAPSFDLSELDNEMSPFAQKLYNFFTPLKESWNIYGTQVVSAFQNAISGIETIVITMWGSVETIFTNGTIYSIISNILDTIGQIGNAWASAWNNDNNGTEIIQGIANMINDITTAILMLVSSTGFQTFLNGIVSSFSGLVQFLEPVIEGFTKMAEKILEIAMSTIGDILQKAGDALQTIGQNETAKEVLKAIGEAIAIIVTAIIAWNVVQLILNGLMGLFAVITSPVTLIILAVVAAITAIILIIKNWGTICEWFKEIWEKLKTKLSQIWDAIKEKVTAVFNNIKTFISNVWNGITTTISNVIEKIKTTISNILNSIKTTWNNIWNGIKTTVVNIWNGIWGAIKSVINSILGGIESFVNGVIKGINKILSGISDVANAAGSLIGLDPINLQLSTISLPRLAKGNVAYSETVAVFGEYAGASNNPEITTPQNVMAETFRDVLSDYEYSNNKSNGEIKQIVFQFGSYRVAVEMEKLLQQARRQNGTATVTI